MRLLNATAARRLASVDALRGLTVAAMLLVNNAGDWQHVHPWLEHAAWHGFTPADLVFPLFLFIVGVSVALGLAPALERGKPKQELARQVLMRTLRIVLLGLALHAVAWWALEPRAFRPMGVLQRIGLCYGAAALALIHLRAGAQWALMLALWGVHAALLAAGGSLEPWVNLSDRLDTGLLGPHAYQVDAATGASHDPEGPLGTLSAIAGSLLGVRAGVWLRAGQLRRLWIAGAVALAAGLAWALWQPLNKNLWTPSFSLFSGGLCLLLLALVHEAVDVRGAPALGRVLGLHAITAYALAWLGACALGAWSGTPALYAALFARPLQGVAPWVPSLLFAAAFTALVWIAMRGFERRGWRITV